MRAARERKNPGVCENAFSHGVPISAKKRRVYLVFMKTFFTNTVAHFLRTQNRLCFLVSVKTNFTGWSAHGCICPGYFTDTAERRFFVQLRWDGLRYCGFCETGLFPKNTPSHGKTRCDFGDILMAGGLNFASWGCSNCIVRGCSKCV